ncbi:MAG TPA: PqqD family protein [Acidimicrobiales bacterium]|nr:PqqD family protein [Acidimicrobiales bacterium]
MDARVVVRTGGQAVREFDIDDSLSLYRAGTERVVVLNGSARRLWQLVAQPRSIEQLVDHLAEEYDVAATDIADGVATAVAALQAEGLLCIQP